MYLLHLCVTSVCVLKLLILKDWFPHPGAARGHGAVEWGTSVPELCGLATQKNGSRSTPGM